MLQQLLGKIDVILTHSLGEPECIAEKLNNLFVK